MIEMAFASATELARMIRARQIGCRELLDYYLDRVDLINPGINAVVTLDAERAHRRADELDASLAAGGGARPLHGVPITLKDTIEVEGLRTTAGAEIYSDHVPSSHGPVVRSLENAGAVIYGKTNTPTLAQDLQSYNPLFGTTNNPWDVSRTPGGSSGGPAAAVAAGLTGFDIGSDVGGSIRHPAHCCGVYGHKPTHGIVSFRGHVPGPPGTLRPFDIWSLGPIARSAEDLALILDVIAGPEPENRLAWSLELPPPRRSELGDFKVAAWLDDPECSVDSAVGNALESLVQMLGRSGVAVDTRARPPAGLAEAANIWGRLFSSEHTPDMADAEFNAAVEKASSVVAADDTTPPAEYTAIRRRDWLQANEERHQLRARYEDFFSDYDVLLAPVSPVPAITHDQSDDTDARRISINGEQRPYWDQLTWMIAFGVCLLPVTVAPAGLTPDGLPVGVQIVGPNLQDRTTIEFARLLAEVTGGFTPPPGL